MRFEGGLSLKNNGGFSSIRTIVKKGYFKGATLICINVRDNGREYQFRLRDNLQFDGYAYITTFKTQENVWQELCFSEDYFSPQFRGRTLSNVPPIKLKNITQLGFLIADKKESEFKLDIRSIRKES